MEKLIICDSTLRDGEQSPDAGMTFEQKIKLGQALMDMGVDVLEAGFAKTSDLDAQVIYHLSQLVQKKDVIISSLGRCCKEDIDASVKALKPALDCGKGRIHVFLASSQKHIDTKLKKTKSQIIQMIKESIEYARQFSKDIQFSAEDATRSEIDFVVQCAQTAIDAGARTINFADTVGQMVDTQMQEFFEDVIGKLNYPLGTVFSVHCHNDKGLATANSLFAIKGGARQVECCMNGLGERAGNAALEEVVMAIRTTPDRYPFSTKIDFKKIMSVAQMVENFSGFQISKNKPIIGKNAFLHASGIHQDGIIKAKQKGIKVMYSAIDPDILDRKDDIMITRHSGVNALIYFLTQQGIDISCQKAKKLMDFLKNQANHPKSFSNSELCTFCQKLN